MNFKSKVNRNCLFILVSLLLSVQCLFATSPVKITRLTCEYLENPLGIDEKFPRFAWELQSVERNQSQSAYEIIIGDNLKDIQQGKGNYWQTGKVISSENIQIVYMGNPLKSFTKYFWRVKIYDKDGNASPWSTINSFETAMLDNSEWKATWIGDGSKIPVADEDYYKDDHMPLFRKEFSIKKKIVSARLYISGVGYYEAFLNGAKIGNDVLQPGFATWKKEVQYTVYDVTSFLKNGKNVAAVMLGNGWWNPLPLKLFGRFDLRQHQQTGRPCVKAEVHVKYSDGSSDLIVTDETWQTKQGPVVRNNVYLGEVYDARLEENAWNGTGVVSSDWKNAVNADGPSGKLSAQMQPPVRVTKTIMPVKITEPKADTFIVDMGQNFAGVVRIKVKGPSGTAVHLRYGEDIYKDGTLDFMTSVCGQIKWGNGGTGAPKIAWQEDDYILKGKGIETWNPRFTFHGFRYVEITGWPGKPTLNDIEGLRMNSDVDEVGNFECSNEQFNQLHKAIQWTFLSNIFSVQSDCPAREKMGYGADIVVTANSFIYNYDMSQFYAKTIRDYANEQQPDGGITEIAPYTGIADKGYGGESGPLGWELVFPYLQNQLYDFYGDKRIVEKNYEALKKQIAFLKSKAVDNLFHWDISDHEALDTKPEGFTASAFYYHHIKVAERFGGILGKKEDSIEYSKLANQVKEAIINRYNVVNTGRFDNATQSAQLFALWYGFAKDKDAAMNVLRNEFTRHNGHVATGIFSTRMLFDVFRENNLNDVAYSIANQKDFPGWLYMLNHGATTLWESWAYSDNIYSQNHPMFGSIDEWFYRSLLGINNAAPGFKKIIIKPQPAGDLTSAKGSYRSVYGNIKSEWRKQGSDFELKISIPVNTTALVYIPSVNNNPVKEDNKAIDVLRYENGYAVIETGSGNFSFRSTVAH
ncbi:MAG: family 78 glycoside hydrolase catalytic domain [Chitinophagaceae bacterium]